MEIIVQGNGVEYFTPNEVIFNINFNIKEETYEKALMEGVKNVQSFVDEILIKNGFSKDDMKTRSFVIREDQRYDEATRQYVFQGFSFSQNAVLKFDYDKNRIAYIMEAVAKLENAPVCRINFGVKDERECKRRIVEKAYKDAELQAQAIAYASGKNLKQCLKVDFKPFTTDYISKSHLESDIMDKESALFGAAPSMVNTFTPEDIEISETLYCLWVAE